MVASWVMRLRTTLPCARAWKTASRRARRIASKLIPTEHHQFQKGAGHDRTANDDGEKFWELVAATKSIRRNRPSPMLRVTLASRRGAGRRRGDTIEHGFLCATTSWPRKCASRQIALGADLRAGAGAGGACGLDGLGCGSGCQSEENSRPTRRESGEGSRHGRANHRGQRRRLGRRRPRTFRVASTNSN